MSDEASDKFNVMSHIFSHILQVPSMSKMVLIVGALLAGVGITGKLTGSAPAQQTQGTSVSAVDSHGQPQSTSADVDQTPFWSRWSTKLGLGFVSGFVIGWAFRAFLKLMSTLTLVGGLVLAGLSYFNVMNIDMTAAKQKYDGALHWITDQAGRLKDVAVDHMPGSGGAGAVGSFFGFRRKKPTEG